MKKDAHPPRIRREHPGRVPVCGTSLKAFTPKQVHNMVFLQVVNNKMMSADKPGAIVPDVNHFVIGRTAFGEQVLTSDPAGATTAKYLPNGDRRSAADVLKDL